MKSVKIIICLTLCLVLFASCSPVAGPSASAEVTPSAEPTEKPTENPTLNNGPTENPTLNNDPTENPTQPNQGTNQVDIYADGNGLDLLVGIDEFGRVLTHSYGTNDRQVGMFYWLWHGSYPNKIVDTTKLIEQYGLDYVLHNGHEYNPTMQPHYWGEPLYGYYSSNDEYVLRKHMEMFTYMGLDFIMFDGTNTLTYPNIVRKICNIIIDMQNDGFDPPRIAYYTHTASIQTVLQVYDELYSHQEYSDAWYCVDGKPFIVAQTDAQKDRERTRSQHAHLADYDPDPLPEHILDFFTFRTPAWVGNDTVTQDGWPWVDWNYPPDLYGNVISVSPAVQHWSMFSWTVTPEHERPDAPWCNGRTSWGRGYDVTTDTNNTDDAAIGKFYQTVWDNALMRDPEYIFIGGWNEFMSGIEYNEEYGVYQLYDSFNMEFSRDLEPIKGGYNDAFLMQTAINVQKYLSDDKAYTFKTPVKKAIDITAGVAQWDGVDAVYKFVGSKNYNRKSVGAVPRLRYTQDAAANSIQEVRITADANNIYMYIRCDNDITMTAENSMNVFIGTGTPSVKGWESYEYVVNRTRNGNTASIMALDSNAGTTLKGDAKMNVSGKIMQLEIPKSVLNMQNDTFYFKVADSVEQINDIMDYYVSGRCMPMGRFSYQYLG